MKYVNTAVVFQEIPNEISLAINISNCPCHCPGCHSKFLWSDSGKELNEKELSSLINSCSDDITCVSFMGGDAEPQTINELAKYIKEHFPKFKTAWYSGRIRLSSKVDLNNLDYLKLGPYLAHLGPINSKTTNQRLYQITEGNKLNDITSFFWKK